MIGLLFFMSKTLLLEGSYQEMMACWQCHFGH